MLNKNWPLIENSECDKAAISLEDELNSTVNRFFPVNEKVINTQTNKPWYNQKLLTLKE
jgi:hypothetical protein